MTRVEQHKLILAVKDYVHKMRRYDLDEFEVLLKRDKDDEDLDSNSQKRLLAFYEQYVPASQRLPW